MCETAYQKSTICFGQHLHGRRLCAQQESMQTQGEHANFAGFSTQDFVAVGQQC